jgi:hypothetical protein
VFFLAARHVLQHRTQEIAFYFTFLRRLTTGMLYILPLAVAFQVVQLVGASALGWAGQPVESAWALVATCSYGVLLDAWRMEQASCSHLWGVFGFGATLSERAEHVLACEVKRHAGTGALVYEFPKAARRKAWLVSTLVTLACVAVLSLTVVGIFAWKARLVATGASSAMLLLPTILNTTQVAVFGGLYQMVAEYLTNYENHRTAVSASEKRVRPTFSLQRLLSPMLFFSLPLSRAHTTQIRIRPRGIGIDPVL